MNKILVIEDDAGIRSNILDLLEAEGFDGIGADDGESGVALAVRQLPALIICDIAMPGIDGYEVFEILSMQPTTAAIPFIFLSARAERADIRRGMTLGADDYLTKPFTRSELLDSIRARLRRSTRVLAAADMAQRPAGTSDTRADKPSDRNPDRNPDRTDKPSEPLLTNLAPGVVVADPSMRALYLQIERIAHSPISVLILGETGVGKEIIAEQVHRASGRKGRFVALNCAALTESLVESELFGFEKGSFTGAVQSRQGLFESAEGGTLFLDEIGDLPLSTQVKLLRVLEERRVVRVGGRSAREIDVRFVAATHRDIEAESTAGTFRQDLFFRLNGVMLQVPALRERSADIEPLTRAFIEGVCKSTRRQPAPEPTREALQLLASYAWPGNIRELRNVVERAVLLAEGGQLDVAHLPNKLRCARATPTHEPTKALDPRAKLLLELEQVERQRIIDTLSQCAGNQTQAAERLGISRRTLVTRLAEYELPRPRKR